MSYASEQAVLNTQFNAAEAAFMTEIERQRPFYMLRPPVFPDGNMWCALYGEDLQMGVAGFGETPELAAADFDKNWREQRLHLRTAPISEQRLREIEDGEVDNG